MTTMSETEKRERRSMERKLAEMEEELKVNCQTLIGNGKSVVFCSPCLQQFQKLKAENEKLKAENRALTRVVSKLSQTTTLAPK